MIFVRIKDNKSIGAYDVEKLGFNIKNPYFIPDDYLKNKVFFIMRICFGFGDWGIISAMPRLLKMKYPDCKVYLPSEKFLNNLLPKSKQYWSSWSNPYKNQYNVFKLNPYVDGYLDEINGEIYHDHYRIYDTTNINDSLICQILRFWQFSENEIIDYYPELYFSEDEIETGNKIIEKYNEYGVITLSDRFQYSDYNINKILENLDNNIPYFYWFSKNYNYYKEFNTKIKLLDNLDNQNIRIQSYIRSKAKLNIGLQSGVIDTISRYSVCKVIPHYIPTDSINSDYLTTITYI